VFRVDYTVEVAGNKEFGSLFLQNGQQQENVALSIVQNGWAKVCRAGWRHQMYGPSSLSRSQLASMCIA
jgi:staphylococcal nuclease domain-containing protein 1